MTLSEAADTVSRVTSSAAHPCSPPLPPIDGDGASGFRARRAAAVLCTLLVAAAGSGCSVRKLAVKSLASTLGDASTVFARDDDPELIADALPFALKTTEALIAEVPGHRGLLLSACQGFTLYGYAFVEVEAERAALAELDYRRSEALRQRALGLYRRARDYCLEALESLDPGVSERLRRTPENALGPVFDRQVELLYWTGAAWGAAIAVALDQPEMVADLPAVRVLLERALELDPDFGQGAVHDAMIILEAVPETMGGSLERAREHFDRVVALTGGQRAGTFVTWAQKVAVQQQDRQLYRRMLERALAVDLEALPDERLANRINQRRAQLLLDNESAYFLDDPPAEDPP